MKKASIRKFTTMGVTILEAALGVLEALEPFTGGKHKPRVRLTKVPRQKVVPIKEVRE